MFIIETFVRDVQTIQKSKIIHVLDQVVSEKRITAFKFRPGRKVM
jgi:hypothetical protein